MEKQLTKRSLRESALSSIGEFLYEEKFPTIPLLKDGILELINLISDYHEEGQKLYPEILIVTDWDYFKSISNRDVIIKSTELTVDEFSKILKLCAPLAVGNWNIVIEVKGNQLKYGLIDAEIIETSPSLHEQTVGNIGVVQQEYSLAYIRNIGSKTVELIGQYRRFVISLDLLDQELGEGNDLQNICADICSECDQHLRQTINTFIFKTVSEAIRIGHGNLIAVIDDNDEDIERTKCDFHDCIFFEKLIDFQEFIRNCNTVNSNDNSVNLLSHSKIFISMLNHDGITIITNKARIVGYHMFIQNIEGAIAIDLNGGARTRAFQSMVNSEKFLSCFYKSQDGKSKYWKK